MVQELAIVRIPETVRLPISVQEAVDRWEQYQDLTRKLLNETDYQGIGGRQFKKKSAWRKYANAFNISDRVTFEEIHRAEDGYPLWARVRVMATHPNGRTSEADHECHLTERCCPGARGQHCSKVGNHEHCPAGCDGRIHYSHPGDLVATATTRAKNRAISDLIGAGEVSAEEMDTTEAAATSMAQGDKGFGVCPEHGEPFFKSPKMRSPAHRLPDGSWCNKPKDAPTKPQAAPVAQADAPHSPAPTEGTQAIQEPQAPITPVPAAAYQPQTRGDLFTAAQRMYKLSQAQVLGMLGVGTITEITDVPAAWVTLQKLQGVK